MELDTLKTYLVKIKHEVDNEAKKKAFAEVDSTKNKLQNMFSFISSGTLKAGAMIASTIISVNSLLLKTISSVSEADVRAERFARSMWTTEKNARSMLSALDAVGSDFNDIFNMTPEEFSRLMDLRNFSMKLEAPKELQDTLVLMRDINHEIDKLQVLFDYAKNWFVYSFGKYAGKDLNEMKESLKDFRNFVTEKMPYAMDILAKGFYMIFRLGKAGVYVVKTLGETLFNLFDRIPGKAKLAGAGILGFLAMLKLGPLGLFITALTTLLLLVEDYMGWKEGKKAYLSSTWEKLDEAFANEDSSLNKVKDTFLIIFDTATDILSFVTDITSEIVEWNKETEALSMLFEGILNFVDQIATVVSGITGYWGFLRDKDKLMEEYKSGNITKDEYAKQREDMESNYWGGVFDFWKNIFKIDEETKAKIDSKLPSWLPGNANQTAAKTTVGMLPAKTNNIVNNQTTNVSVIQSPYESAESTGMKVANKVSSIRPWGTVFV